MLLFQSTPPARGATNLLRIEKDVSVISIHAPREGGDLKSSTEVPEGETISIHAPREGGDDLPEDAPPDF